MGCITFISSQKFPENMKDKDWYFLFHLAKKTALHGECASSTGALAGELGISQQTVSRKLQELATAGYLLRTVSPDGVTLRMTEKGKQKIAVLYGDLQKLFSQQCMLSGTVKEGLGEGRFYMSQEQYKKQFQNLLGFVPYPGTLNLKVDKNTAEMFLAAKHQHYIAGFATKERTFGGLKCYPVVIAEKMNGAIIIPDRSVHALDTVEIIAPVYLRQTLKLENGKEVCIQ